MELASGGIEPAEPATTSESVCDYEERLLSAVGEDRHDEAREIIDTGRISWKLRDDDNLLIARLESQLLRALETSEKRLRSSHRIVGERRATAGDCEFVVNCLRDPSAPAIELNASMQDDASTGQLVDAGETPRQLIGQPASPCVSVGRVRCIRGRGDLGQIKRGEVLVCDAIQPTMTHLVLLASGIVERRGGMLIHGAIIARELGIPCVNGIRNAANLLSNGDFVTVDGHLGIVTIGAPELDLELRTEFAQ